MSPRALEVSEQASAGLLDEQASLRRVATLVARAASADELFSTVAQELGQLLDVDVIHIGRYEPDGTIVGVASWSAGEDNSIGASTAIDGDDVTSAVWRTGHPARVDRTEGATGSLAAAKRRLGVRSSVGVPITVDRQPWGVVVVRSMRDEPLAEATEDRTAAFAELVATAMSNLEARADAKLLTDEQTALRRVATLVADGVPPSQLFDAVVREVGVLLEADVGGMIRYESDDAYTVVGRWVAGGEQPPVGMRWSLEGDDFGSAIARTRNPVRIDDYEGRSGRIAAFLRDELGVRSSVGCPVVVDGEVWGGLFVHSRHARPLPAATEARLENFTELVGTAIANAQSRAEIEQLAAEQAALRRVAVLIAQGVTPTGIFSAVCDEVAGRFNSEHTAIARFEGSDAVVVGTCAGIRGPWVGMRVELEDPLLITDVYRTGRPARRWALPFGPIAKHVADGGPIATVAAPIFVEGNRWGVMIVWTPKELPPGAENRLESFTELVATAIANAESRAEVEQLAGEQAALRRVATLVAEDVPASELFGAVAHEVGTLFGADLSGMIRYEDDATVTTVATWAAVGEHPPVADRWTPEPGDPASTIARTRQTVRMDDWPSIDGPIAAHIRGELGVRSTVASPIIVDGRLWGAVALHSRGESLAADTESRLLNFTHLVATAIANSSARAEVARLVEEQTALRRVATLVARGASPTAVFDAVAAEMAALLSADGITLCRYEEGGDVTILAHVGSASRHLPPGTRVAHDSTSVTATVRRTGQPARMDTYADTHGQIGDVIEGLRFRSGVGVPIVVDGRLWGVTVANWASPEPPPPDTEMRMAQFGELLDTAFANADGRDQLMASRARLLVASDDARRRVVRDLHDGAQQRLVHTVVTLKLAQRALQPGNGKAEALLAEALAHAGQANRELRELAQGILPAALTRGGLRAGVSMLVSRTDVPVSVDVPAARFAPEVEASAYFVVAEALTNVVKHARATRADVRVAMIGGTLLIEVRDDGVGGAVLHGTGLAGLEDRLAALGGRLQIESPVGGGTLVGATLPLDGSH